MGLLRTVFLGLFLFSICFATTGTYTVIIAENGNALVFAKFLGEGIVNVPLPIDVDSVQVSGAVYLPASNGIDLSLTLESPAFVTYESALLVTDVNGANKLGINLPNIPITLTASFPGGTNIQNTMPEAQISQTENAVNVLWQVTATAVSAQYTSGTTGGGTTDISTPMDFFFILIFGIALVIVALTIFFAYSKKKVKPSKAIEPKTKETGKNSVIKILSENQKKIVSVLMENKGEMKRNKLERVSSMSKSSLAATLNQLEKRKIIEMDKGGKVHYIRFSDWFRGL